MNRLLGPPLFGPRGASGKQSIRFAFTITVASPQPRDAKQNQTFGLLSDRGATPPGEEGARANSLPN